MIETVRHTQKEMKEKGVDILVATTPENVTYTTGFRGLSHQILRGTLVFSVTSKDKNTEPLIILPIGEADRLFCMDRIPGEIITFGNFSFTAGERLSSKDKKFLQQIKVNKWKENALTILINAIKQKYGENLRIGVDERGLTFSEYDLIRKELHNFEVFEAFNTFKEIRTIKTEEEVKKIQKAVSITEKALKITLESIKESITEVELQKIFEKELVGNGAVPAFTVIGFGENGAHPNAKPSNKKLKKGELVRFDVGCTYDCYFSDIARTAVLGAPSEKQKRYYEAILEGEQRILENIKEGAVASNLFEIGVKTISETLREYKRHHVGHGIGIEVYDYPLLAPENNTILKENMTMCIETPFYEFGFGGWQIEDEILVTREGFKLLTSLERNLFVL